MTKKITKKTKFSELLKYPEIVEELMRIGMHCVGCAMASQETIAQGAKAHGLNPDKLIKKLNNKLNKK